MRLLLSSRSKHGHIHHLHRESHLIFEKKNIRQTLSTNFIQHIFSNNCLGAHLKFQLKGAVLIGRRVLNRREAYYETINAD